MGIFPTLYHKLYPFTHKGAILKNTEAAGSFIKLTITTIHVLPNRLKSGKNVSRPLNFVAYCGDKPQDWRTSAADEKREGNIAIFGKSQYST